MSDCRHKVVVAILKQVQSGDATCHYRDDLVQSGDARRD